jgi:hypothetical protein
MFSHTNVHSTLIVLAILIPASTLASIGQAQFAPVLTPPQEFAPGFNSITSEQAKQWLSVLASPAFEGRGTGQTGYIKAAHYVSGKLAEMGIEPAGDEGTYFQMLPMKRRVPVINECYIVGPAQLKINGETHFGFDRYTDDFETSGEAVFLNFSGSKLGIPEEFVLRDKIVFYVADEAAAAQAPRILARKRPAAAMRIIDGVPKSISQLVRGAGDRSSNISGTITRESASQINAAVGGPPSWIGPSATAGVAVHESGQSVTIAMRVREENGAVPNVVGWLQGSDPTVNHEYIVVGSHLDHLGVRSGTIFPGADDNGSGSTAVLSIARAFAENPVRPRRSVLFIWFAAEEIGLVGSKYYCDNPRLPLQNMTCMFNIDMVGRNEESENETSAENEGAIHLVGSKKGDSEIHQLIVTANQYVGFRFEYDGEDVFNRSDQHSFYEKGVPVAFLFGGFHPDYHQPSDQISEINFDKIVAAARLFFVAINLATDHGRFEIK